jgi:hypothetical protein
MAATITAGHHAIIYASGTAATLTSEPCTNLSIHKVYQITAAAKQVLSPTYAVTTNGTGAFTVNRLTGTLTFATDQTANEPITLTGKYLPMGQLLYAKDFSLSMKIKAVETTPFGQNYQALARGLNDANGTIGTFYDPTEVASLSVAPYWNTQMLADATIAIKFYVSANYSFLAWAEIDTEELKAAIDGGSVEQTISWSGVADADGHEVSRL